jgi:signal transduction histidine kinase
MSIRAKVTAIAVLLTAVALALMSVGVYLLQRQTLMNGLEESLVLEADALLNTPPLGSIPTTLDDDLIAQVVVSGEVVASTPNIEVNEPLTGTGTRLIDLPIGDDTYMVVTRSSEDLTVHIGAPIDDIDHASQGLSRNLAFFAPLTVAAVGGIVWWLVGRTLAPVERIRLEAAAINAQSLNRRVPDPKSGDEISALAGTMNQMLDRVEQGVDSQRRFVADASHELRTPLTRLRSSLEVDLAHPETADCWATISSTLEETVGMQRLVDDLLVLATGGSSSPLETVRIDDLVRDQVESMGVRFELDLSATSVMGHPKELSRAVRNLLDNATRHGKPPFGVTVFERDGQSHVMVSDHGPGIPHLSRDAVFERFTTLDESRAGGGVGLGLAISREIIQRHGGSLDIDPDYAGGSRFHITIPST